VTNRLNKLFNVEDHELKAAIVSFLFVFTLMAAYYLLRPVRDAMASDWTDAEVSWLWTINFFISTAIVALYGFIVSKVNFQKLVPSVYLFFSASFFLFFILTNSAQDVVLAKKSYYVWVSVFALFHVSVFWSFMADVYNKEQSKRLFSIFAAGASLGAIFGPLLSAIFVGGINLGGLKVPPLLETNQLLLVAAVMLLIPIPLIAKLTSLKHSALGNAEQAADLEKVKIGGNPLNGFKEFFTNPYLLGIGLFIILYTGIGSFVYLEQKNLLAEYPEETRTAIYGYRDFVINTVTFILAFFLTGRIVTKLGMPTALALLPVVIFFGMLVLAFSPVLMVAVALWFLRSAGNYGLTRPAREMLFTQVSREDRFKTKPVIDIVAYRGGDVIMGWFFTGLTQGLGLGLGAVAAVGAGIAALWAFVGIKLGQKFEGQQKPD